MSDIVERLRKENSMLPYYGPPKLQEEAADRIEQLEAALRELGDHNRFGWTMQTEIARAALEDKCTSL
jgi:hypothetical protein